MSGTVRIRGKPMNGGQIAFDPSNYKRPDTARSATIGSDGTYTITTLQGRNLVRVSGPAILKEPQLGYSIQSVDVKSDNPPFDVDIPPK